MSLCLRSTIPCSSVTNPLQCSKVKATSRIQYVKGVVHMSSEQKQSKQAGQQSIVDRRNVLLGVGGLFVYGASSDGLGNQPMIALGAPLTDLLPDKKNLVNKIKFWRWKTGQKNDESPPLPADEHATIRKQHGEVWSELVVDVPADEIWAVYSSPDLPRLIVELLPERFEKIDIVEGDGGLGTVLHCILNPASSGPREWTEEIVKMDHETRTKVVRQIQGGYLDLGFYMYQHIFTITAKDANSCVIRMTASFDVDEKSESKASLIFANWGMGKAIAKYVVESKNKNHGET